jgi:hypothetical protein
MNTTQQKAPGATNAKGHDQNTSTTNSAQYRAAHKYQRTAKALLLGPKNSFELERAPTFDHCANSTIAELKKRYGLVIYTQLIRVTGYENQGALIAEYRLAEESRAKALSLLERA